MNWSMSWLHVAFIPIPFNSDFHPLVSLWQAFLILCYVTLLSCSFVGHLVADKCSLSPANCYNSQSPDCDHLYAHDFAFFFLSQSSRSCPSSKKIISHECFRLPLLQRYACNLVGIIVLLWKSNVLFLYLLWNNYSM